MLRRCLHVVCIPLPRSAAGNAEACPHAASATPHVELYVTNLLDILGLQLLEGAFSAAPAQHVLMTTWAYDVAQRKQPHLTYVGMKCAWYRLYVVWVVA